MEDRKKIKKIIKVPLSTRPDRRCDHKWGDGPNEYSKCRVESYEGIEYDLCDICSMIIYKGKELGYR